LNQADRAAWGEKVPGPVVPALAASVQATAASVSAPEREERAE
jgi:hypothetical protein